MTTDQLRAIHNSLADLRGVSSDLRSLSRAFESTGNDVMSAKLESLSAFVRETGEAIDTAIGASIQHDCSEASKHLFDAITGSLAAITQTAQKEGAR